MAHNPLRSLDVIGKAAAVSESASSADVSPHSDQLMALLSSEVGDALLASGIVGLFYWFRFNNMRGTRSYTTAALYYIGVVCFILPFIGIYGLIVAASVSKIVAICVLILVWVLPALPEAWRSVCHNIAAIPGYAHRFKELLATAEFSLRQEDEPAIRRKLARCGYDVSDFVAAQATGIQARLLKMAAIMHHLEVWEQECRVFMQRNEETYHALQEAFDLLTFKIIRAIKNVTKINAAIADQGSQSDVNVDDWRFLDSLATRAEPVRKLHSVIQTAMGGNLEDLRKDIDFFLDQALLFVVRGTLANERSFAGRRRRLETIGFTIDLQPPSIVPAAVNAILIAVVCSTLWFLAIGSELTFENPRTTLIRLVVLTLVTLGCNFYSVYYFRRNFAFANESSSGKPPLLFIMTVGLVTALCVIPVRLTFDWYTDVLIPDYARVVPTILAMSLPPWLFGALTALLSQESMWISIGSQRVQRLLDGAVYGLGTTASVLFLWAVNGWMGIHIPALDNMSTENLLWTIASYSAIYAVIGYLVFARFRDLLSLRKPMFAGSTTATVFEMLQVDERTKPGGARI